MRHQPDNTGAALFNFCKYALGMKDLQWHVHGELCLYLENMYHGNFKPNSFHGHVCVFMDLLPRGHLKTSVVTIGWPLWIFFQDDPPIPGRKPGWSPPPSFNGKKSYNQRFLICGETRDKVKEFMGPIKQHLEENEFLNYYYGSLVPPDKKNRTWQADRLKLAFMDDITAKEANVNATSLDSAKVGKHVDIGILDDVVTSEQVKSDEMIKKGIEFFDGLKQILDPPVALCCINGTRWHDGDLYGHLIDNHSSRTHIYIERAERTQDDIAAGKRPIFWPERFPRHVLDGMKATQDPWFYQAQMNNTVIDSETALFKKWFFQGQEFEIEGDVVTLPGGDRRNLWEWLAPMTIATTIDPAIAKGKDACNAVVVTCAWDHRGHCWLLDLFRHKNVTPNELLDEIFRQNRYWKPRSVGMETRGFQIIYQYNASDKSRELREYPPFVELKDAGRSKEFRIRALEPICRAKRFHWQKRFDVIINEFLRYPRGKYKDGIDALSYQLDIAYRGKTPTEDEPEAGTPEATRRDIWKLHEKKLAQLGIKAYRKKGVKSWIHV